MKTYIVILNFGDTNITKNCIKSLYKVETEKFNIIIVNNNSDKLDSKHFTDKNNLSVINNFKNLGFSGGVNVGISYALKNSADCILLLNNDTSIKLPILKKLQGKLFSQKNIGIVGPTISFIKNGKTIYDIGGSVNKITGRTSHEEIEGLNSVESKEVEYISGCCMLVKKDVFEKAGFFDTRFFLYYEDVDFCLRAQKAGFGVWVEPAAVIFHELSKTIGKISGLALYHQTRSGKIFGKKWLGTNRIFNLGFLGLQTLLFVLKSPSKGIWALRGLIL